MPGPPPSTCQYWPRHVRLTDERRWSKSSERGGVRGVREQNGGTARGGDKEKLGSKQMEGWVYEGLRVGRGEQWTWNAEYCNVTASLKCCVGCLTGLILPKQTGLMWDRHDPLTNRLQTRWKGGGAAGRWKMINEQIYSDVTITWEEYDELPASDWLLEPWVSPLFVHLLCNSQRQVQTEWRVNLIPAQKGVLKVVSFDVRSHKDNVLKVCCSKTTNKKKTMAKCESGKYCIFVCLLPQ